MALIDEPKLRDIYNISADVKSGLLARAIGAASRRPTQWVGAAAYASTNPETKSDLEFAEAQLAMHFALLGMNTVITPGGVVRTQKVEGDTVITYLTPNETKQLAAEYLAQAEEAARPYALADGTPDAGLQVVADE